MPDLRAFERLPSNSGRLLTVQEVADTLRFHLMSVYRMIRNGDLPVVRLSIGRRKGNLPIRVRQADLDLIIEGAAKFQPKKRRSGGRRP